MASKSTKGVIVLSVIFAAVFAGYLWLRNPDNIERKLAESVKRSERVLDLYLNAHDDSAKLAIVEHLSYLDSLSRESADENRNPFASDAMVWCVRLAKLEERDRGPNAAEYMRQAVERCKKRGMADCSESGIREIAERMDSMAMNRLKK